MKKTFGKKLLQYRNIQGLTLREVEKKTGVSNGYLNQLEHNKIQEPSPHILHSLAKLYKVPYEHLLQLAGYLNPSDQTSAKKVLGVAYSLLEDLETEEEEELFKYLEFIRQRRRKKREEMKVSLKNPFLPKSSQEVKKQVKYLLSAAGVNEQLPTPKEDIIACAKLVEIGKLDLPNYEERWFKKGANFLKNALSKIKGLLDFKEEIIYINPKIHHSQKTFVTYHEVTHRILRWHKGLYNPHIDDDYSIDPRVAIGLEAEANLGASLIQFQIDRFAKELKDYPLGFASAIILAKKYETSLHSTFRKYVEDNHKPSALLILEVPINNKPENPQFLQLWYSLQSRKFTKEFGIVDWEKFYYPKHFIYDTIFSNSSKKVRSAEITLKNSSGFKKKCKLEAFFNKFNYFVLIYPVSRLRSRKKIIITDS